MIKRILVGLGGTPYTETAITRAVEFAGRFDAEVTGVTVVRAKDLLKSAPAAGAGQSGDSLIGDQVERAVGRFESACRVKGVRHQVEREESADPFGLMISLARYHDLMIFGLRSIFEYRFPAARPKDTLARLVSAGVRPIIAESSGFRPVRKVLIAYSGSMESAKTMKRFIQLRLWPEAELKIVTFKRSEDKARRLLQSASEYCRAHGFVVQTESNPGYPKDFLLPLATYWQADLIVMGNSARSLLVKRILGETALHTIRNADRPLFLCQ